MYQYDYHCDLWDNYEELRREASFPVSHSHEAIYTVCSLILSDLNPERDHEFIVLYSNLLGYILSCINSKVQD